MNPVEISTPLGPMTATFSARGLVSLTFGGGGDKAEDGSAGDGTSAGDGSVRLVPRGACPSSAESPLVSRPVAERLVNELGEYFAGSRKTFDIPLDPRGTPFRERVWAQLLTIPYGSTVTYAEQAAALGDPKSVRASAAANGKNPIAILVPCHRVVGSDGSLTGYAGGLWRKRFLLDLERKAKGPDACS